METIKAKFKRKTCYVYDLPHFILEFLEDRLYHIGIADYIVWIEYPTADCIPEWLANMDAVKSVLNGNGPSEVDIEVPADPFLQNPNVVLDPIPELIAIAEVNCFGSPLTAPVSCADNGYISHPSLWRPMMERVTLEQLNGLCRQVERIYQRLRSACEAMDQNACDSIPVEGYSQALKCADYLLTFSARCYMSTVIGWDGRSKPE